MDYDPNVYIGTDIFSKQRKNMLVFYDRSWFDNGLFSQNSNADTSSEEYKENSIYARDIIDLNEMIISNNYYVSDDEIIIIDENDDYVLFKTRGYLLIFGIDFIKKYLL